MYPTYNPIVINPNTTTNIDNTTEPGFWESIIRKWSRSGLTGAEKSQNDYNAQQAELARQFSVQQAQEQMAFQSREAELARDWQEYMYNQYQSPEAMMRQYAAVGLNPALMYGSASGGSIPSASSGPSGASGSSVSASGSPLSAHGNSLIQSLVSLVKLRSEIDNINADTRQKESATGLVSAQTKSQEIANFVAESTKDTTIEIAQSNLTRLLNDISKQNLDISEAQFNISTQEVRRALLVAEKELKQWQAKEVESTAFMKSLEKRFYEQKDWSTPPSILVPIVSAAIIGGGNVLSKVLDLAFGNKSKVKEIFVDPSTGEIL